MLHTKIAVVGIFALLVSPAMLEAQQNGNNNGESGQVSSNGQISSQTSNQGFVGGGGIGGDPRATSNQANMAGMGMNAMGGFGGFGGMGRGMMGGMFGGQQQQQPGANLRFPFVVKFTVAPIVPAKVRMQAQNRLTKLPGLSKYNKVAVQIKGVTATLTGQVVSQREKSLVERLVLLEPGINDVRNDLVIAEKKP